MKTILAFLLAGAATPALAQQSGQPAPAAPSSSATCTPEHAAAGHCTLPAPAPQKPAPAPPASGATCTPEHAAAGHCTLPAPAPQAAPTAPPSSTICTPEHAAMGHCTLPAPAPQPPATPPSSATCLPEHAAMGHCTPAAAATPPVLPPPPAALSGPEHAADGVYGTPSMAEAREDLRREHGALPAYKVFFDRIETRVRDGSDSYVVEGEAWYGGDIDKLWVKTELEGEWGEGVEGAELQGLWSHAIDPWFDVQAGVRYDPRKGPDRAHLVLGIQGLAPYWWEVDGAVFLSNKGEVTARAEAEYDLRITQKLILQPRAEVDLSLQDIPELHIGAGLTSAAIGARLRYQVTPLVAPYVGVEYERAFGDTRRFLREEGESAGGFNLLAGVRVWF
ncbi:MAG: copper resistance protein B [Sphingomonas sp.]|nr:copper resistance protein B [Sphingomonas sp.]